MGKKSKKKKDREKLVKPPPEAKKPTVPDEEYAEATPDPHTGEGVRSLFEGTYPDDDKHMRD